jgi:hypothetical protein
MKARYPYKCAVCGGRVDFDSIAGQDAHYKPSKPYHNPLRPGTVEGSVEVSKDHYLYLVEQINRNRN